MCVEKLIVADDKGGDDGDSGSDPVVLEEAPAVVEEVVIEDDLAHVLEPTGSDLSILGPKN